MRVTDKIGRLRIIAGDVKSGHQGTSAQEGNI